MENKITALIEKINQSYVLIRQLKQGGTLWLKMKGRITTLLEELNNEMP